MFYRCTSELNFLICFPQSQTPKSRSHVLIRSNRQFYVSLNLIDSQLSPYLSCLFHLSLLVQESDCGRQEPLVPSIRCISPMTLNISLLPQREVGAAAGSQTPLPSFKSRSSGGDVKECGTWQGYCAVVIHLHVVLLFSFFRSPAL